MGMHRSNCELSSRKQVYSCLITLLLLTDHRMVSLFSQWVLLGSKPSAYQPPSRPLPLMRQRPVSRRKLLFVTCTGSNEGQPGAATVPADRPLFKRNGLEKQRGRGVDRVNSLVNPWRATVVYRANQIHIGCYESESLAAKAYDAYVIKHFIGEPDAPLLNSEFQGTYDVVTLPKPGEVSQPQVAYKGIIVRKSGGCEARITVKGKQVNLGTYNTEEEAARVYDTAVWRYGEGVEGNSRRLNFGSLYRGASLGPQEALYDKKVAAAFARELPDSGQAQHRKGATWRADRGKWLSVISKNSKRYFLGYFATQTEAAATYAAAEKAFAAGASLEEFVEELKAKRRTAAS